MEGIAADAPSPATDPNALDALQRSIGREATARIVQGFLTELPGRLEQVRAAADAAALARAAHALGSAASVVGATGLVERTAAAEAGAAVRVEDIVQEAGRAEAALRQVLAALGRTG